MQSQYQIMEERRRKYSLCKIKNNKNKGKPTKNFFKNLPQYIILTARVCARNYIIYTGDTKYDRSFKKLHKFNL